MLRERSILNVTDNSGAVKVMVFAVNGQNGRKSVSIGDVVRCSVKKATPRGKVKKTQVVSALIVRTRRKVKRPDGSVISFGDNACVIVSKEKLEPVATRVFGPVSRELRDKYGDKYKKIISMSEELV